jgi:sugar lactone lactonase YvrE
MSPPPAVQAREARLLGPRGLAFDQTGNMYVTECLWTYAAIERIDPDGLVTRFAGTGKPGFSGDGGAATEAQLYCPAGIAVGPDGAVYFADHVNNRVRRVDTAGKISTYAGSGPAGLGMGSFSGDGGPATEATLQEPWGVAVDRAGMVYIADRDNARVRRVDAGGTITTVAGNGTHGAAGDGGPATEAELCPPVGVAVDPDGTLFIADACTTAIRTVNAAGTISTIVRTDSPDTTNDTGSEGNIAFDGTGLMYVQAGPRVFRTDITRVITPVAGNGDVGIPTDGSRSVDSPLPLEIWGLLTDDRGYVYIADGAASVWRSDSYGTITRFAGRLTGPTVQATSSVAQTLSPTP